MNAIREEPWTERFREAGTPYLSPRRVGEYLGLRVQELAERAHVHRNTPRTRPQAPQLQKYLQDILRVLAVATAVTGDEGRALFLIRNEPLRAFGYKTADILVQEGRTDAVVAYLESLAGGAAG
ncbi:DNA-binding protein [Luteimonas sp. A277]